MKIGSASGDSLITTANAMRLGEPISAFDLWRLADRKASEKRGDRIQTRLVLYPRRPDPDDPRDAVPALRDVPREALR